MSSAGLLSGKLALITGASSGIGLATAKIFVSEGAQICVTGRSVHALEKLSTELGCSYVAGDLSNETVPEKVVTDAASRLGGLTTLVNCAGILKGGAFGSEKCNLDNFMDNFNINTKAVFQMMQHATPYLIKAGREAGPSIINVSSVNGKQSFQGCANYCASKAATDQLTRCAAVDLAKDGIRVNAVNPGVILTELQKRGGLDDEQYAAFLKRAVEHAHPLGRVGSPEEVGNLIAFLASDKSAFITGETIAIDGGRQCLGAR
eukprot:1132260_1